MSQLAKAAEALCASKYKRTATPSQYIAGFNTRLGRQLALHRTQHAIYCWTQVIPLIGAPASPIRQYAARDTRNSNLNAKNAPSLCLGHAAHYWKFGDTTSFESFLDWYTHA
ncbi:hypothetical protein [Pseudomonas oligotrophica]|uniref:hypothetical protein n=1 Tax=Pseudomonas oligotrophica TaxID=2912055 RepID=UPI001F3AFC96|nr:hypothetical protein [Pseudomonas oligotrophica]